MYCRCIAFLKGSTVSLGNLPLILLILLIVKIKYHCCCLSRTHLLLPYIYCAHAIIFAVVISGAMSTRNGCYVEIRFALYIPILLDGIEI